MFLHGGPGGGSTRKHARFFNPWRYRIILFDQRGCGRSVPNAQDAPAALEHNTTDDLIDDINALREHRHITGPMHVFGGSWGSTLALAYAIKHPENVKTLILRGIFLCRRQDLDYFYQGNATTYPIANGAPGTYLFYPEAWKDFVLAIPPAKRGNMIAAYAEIFSDPANPNLEAAARAWSVWEGLTSYLSPSKDTKEYEDPAFARVFAKIENHYFMNGAFFPTANYLLENTARIAHLPIYIVQGRFDQVCPRFQADELVAALTQANPAARIKYVVTLAGHSQFEPETARALTEIMDNL